VPNNLSVIQTRRVRWRGRSKRKRSYGLEKHNRSLKVMVQGPDLIAQPSYIWVRRCITRWNGLGASGTPMKDMKSEHGKNYLNHLRMCPKNFMNCCSKLMAIFCILILI
jgi:hypothetical protein